MPPAREGDGILPGLRSWSCTTPTNLGFHQTDEILQVVTVGTGGLPAFSRIMSVGEPGSMHPTTALVLSCRGLALGHTIGKISHKRPTLDQLSCQTLYLIPSPTWGRKWRCNCGKMSRSPTINGESPRFRVAQLSQSRDCA